MANQQRFVNNCQMSITTHLSASATQIPVASLDNLAVLPNLTNGDYYMATIWANGGRTVMEIVKITSVDTVHNVLTVVRGQENTVAQEFLYGATIGLNVTAGTLGNFYQGTVDIPGAADEIIFNQDAPGVAVDRTVLSKLRDVYSVEDFGIVGDGVTDNAANMLKLRNWLVSEGAAGRYHQIVWPDGHYVYSQGPNWGIPGLNMRADGQVWLIHTGPGNAPFLMDGSAYPGGLRGLKLTGDFRVYPNASSAQGVWITYVHVSEIEIMSRGAGTGFQAIYIASCVCTLFKIRASSNDGGWVNTPTHALFLTQQAPGDQISYCTFLNPVLEGSPIACYLDGAMGNVFIGGTMEAASNIGLQLTGNAIQNKFIGVDLEVNTNYDILCAGSDNEFHGCDTYTKVRINGGSDNKLIGGLHQAVEVLTPANRTYLDGFRYNRFSGTAYPTNTGTNTRWRDLVNTGTGMQHNVPPTATQLVVGASPYTYTNTTGNTVSVHIQPGTISSVVLNRGPTALPMPTGIGMYDLSPGDNIAVTYSVLPAMFVLTR